MKIRIGGNPELLQLCERGIVKRLFIVCVPDFAPVNAKKLVRMLNDLLRVSHRPSHVPYDVYDAKSGAWLGRQTDEAKAPLDLSVKFVRLAYLTVMTGLVTKLSET